MPKWKPAASSHREPVSKVYYYEPQDRLITCGQDGSFSFWNAQDMSHHKTYHHSGVWANDCVYLPVKRMLACAAFDETVRSYVFAGNSTGKCLPLITLNALKSARHAIISRSSC